MMHMSLTIAAAQSSSVPGDVLDNVVRHLRFATIAAERGVQLLVFPELSLTGYEPSLARSSTVQPYDPRLGPLRQLAEEARMTMVVGAPLLNDKHQLHIAAFAICPDGSVLTYTKEHLHPGEEKVFTSGPGGPTLQIDDSTIALAICADTTHPQHAANASSRGANVYAAGVLIGESGYEPDTALLRQYSLQHRMAILMANHSAPTGGWVSAGKSSIWSEDGKLVAASAGTEEALVIARKHDGVWDGMVLHVTVQSSTVSSMLG
jgi:predicted amidohydrolase